MCRIRGFTLIELLIVMAILTLLAGILFTVFAGAKEKARQTHCMNNLKQLGAAILLYRQDYDGGWPDDATAVYPAYVSNKEVFACPDDGAGSNVRKTAEGMLGVYSSYGRCGGDFLGILSGMGVRIAAMPELDCTAKAVFFAQQHFVDRYPLLRCYNHLFPGSDCGARDFDRLREKTEPRGAIPTLAQDGSVSVQMAPSPYGPNPLDANVAAGIAWKEWHEVLDYYKQQIGCNGD